MWRSILIALALAGPASAEERPAFGLPVECRIGETCFLQKYADMDASPEAHDPACRSATDDGHDGTDFRVKTMADMAAGTAVLAVAAGTVLRGRDGAPDLFVATEAEAERLEGRECGNGLVIDHGGGWETQYCHLKRGSVSVAPGQKVSKGDRIGEIGASGLAQFPHVHLTIRRDGEALDPFTGRPVGSGCGREGLPLWDETAAAQLPLSATALLDMGLAAGPVTPDDLAASVPSAPAPNAPAIVLWAWAINLEEGDRIALRLDGPDGIIAEDVTEPLDRSKAAYAAYAGRKRAPGPGPFRGAVAILRDGKPIIQRERLFTAP